MLVILPSPSRSPITPLYPQSVTNQGACPQVLVLSMFSFQILVRIHQGGWERVNNIDDFLIGQTFLDFEQYFYTKDIFTQEFNDLVWALRS
jgi:hypothetical protein